MRKNNKTKLLKMMCLPSLCFWLIGVQAKAAIHQTVVSKAGIEFVETNSANYQDKIDFAELEHSHPLNKAALQALTPELLAQFSEEELDQIYARLSAGPIPDGPYKGTIIFEKDGGLQGLGKYFAKTKYQRFVDYSYKLLGKIGEFLWKGKHFYKQEGVLRNLIPDDLAQELVLKLLPKVVVGSSPNMSSIPTSVVDNQKYYEVFPAKLYCGQSLLDSRRESVIIDYAYSKDIPHYQEALDVLASKDGLNVRDEIRMIRPGLYLGRAYMQRMFGLIFTLYNEKVAALSDATEDCWVGTQARK